MEPDPRSEEERGRAAPWESWIWFRWVLELLRVSPPAVAFPFPLSRAERWMLLLIADNVVLTF